MIERDKAGRLTWDSKASTAIAGMRKSDLSDKLEMFERHYLDWLGVAVNADGHLIGEQWFTPLRRLQMRIARTAIEIFRAEIATLATAAAEALNDQAAANARENFYPAYLKLVDDQRALRAFLDENFKSYVTDGLAREQSIIEIAKTVMREKGGL
jgi:hypothetical protein